MSRASTICCLLAASLALAPAASAGPDEDRAEASEGPKLTYEDAKGALEAGRHEEALLLFEKLAAEATEAPARWRMLLGQAVTLEEMKRPADAIARYRDFLQESERDPAADNDEWQGLRKAAMDVVRRLESAILETRGQLFLDSTPKGASVVVQGIPTAESVTPANLYLPPGEHQISLSLPGHEPWSETVAVRRGAQKTMIVQLTRTVRLPDPDPVPDPKPPAEGGVPAGAWVTIGVGAATAITGAVFFGLAFDERNEIADLIDANKDEDGNVPQFVRDRYDEAAPRIEERYGAGLAAMITGGAILAGGIVWAVVVDDAPETSMDVDIQAGPDGGGVTLGWRF